MTRTLVLLTLNEINGVRALVPQLPTDIVDEVLAVDGGSTDGTREFFEAHGIHVVVQDRPGRGEAFRVAVRESSGDHLVFFSPDGNEDPSDIPRLFEALDSGADMAIASRFLPGGRNEEDEVILPLRKWVNQAFTFLANVIWNRGPWVSDTINGFRGVRREVFWQLAPESMGYTIEYEMTIRAMKAGMRIVEIPTIEWQRIGGITKGPSFPTGVAFSRFLVSEIVRGRIQEDVREA